MSIRSALVLATVAALFVAPAARADVRLPAIFSDHAVLQAEKPLNVWGWAEAGETVAVTVGTASAQTTAAADGTWSLQLPPLPVGGPFAIDVRGKNAVHVADVLVGEVWLCSGQSNMEMQIRGLHGEVNDADSVIAAADRPTLRMFVHDEGFTLRSTTVPPAEPLKDRPGKWIICTPKTAATFTAMGYFFAARLQDQLHRPVGVINASVGGTTIEAWTSLMAQQAVPALTPMLADWHKQLDGYDPVAAQRAAATSKADWLDQRAAAVKNGVSEPKAPKEADYKNVADNAPGALFNGLIAPLVPYTIRGVLWYQGERNAGGPFTSLYSTQQQTLIADWRKRWGDDFHFAYVQIPNLKAVQSVPSDDKGWAVWVRDGQRQALAKMPNTSMAITIDLGGVTPDFLHPKNKDEFARRSAMLVLCDVYKQSIELPTGPMFREAKIEGDDITLSFDDAAGLRGKHDATQPKGFAIAGADRKFYWATAEVKGEQVVCSSPRVSAPVAVRYGWASNPIGDLQNRAGLPASPFRSDAWPAPGITTTGVDD